MKNQCPKCGHPNHKSKMHHDICTFYVPSMGAECGCSHPHESAKQKQHTEIRIPKKPNDEELSILRAEFLSLEGDDAVEIHGWLLGVAVAVERKNNHPQGWTDALVAELRASIGPPKP